MTIADYTLEYINGIPYLMPYGQSVADLKKCVKLNDTGIFIWNSLSDGFGRDKILSEMCKKYNAVTPDDKTILSDDLDSFLDILTAYRVFERENDIITLPDNSKPHHLSFLNPGPYAGYLISAFPVIMFQTIFPFSAMMTMKICHLMHLRIQCMTILQLI